MVIGRLAAGLLAFVDYAARRRSITSSSLCVVEWVAMAGDCALTGTMCAYPAEALQAVERAFAKAHVFVTEAHQLGGLALVVHWDMEGDHRQVLVEALLEASIDLDEGAFEALRGPWEGVLTGSLHITLEHGGRDSKVPVPAVPG